MNKLSTIALVGLLATSISAAVYAEPTRTFRSETADIAADKLVSLDLEYGVSTTASGTGVRIGAMGGEILLNKSNSGFATSSIGYKRAIQENLAAYGFLSYLNNGTDSFTDFALGVAYTIKQEKMTFNVNGELITDDSASLRGGNTTVFIKGAIKYPINNTLSNSSLIAEIAVENNDAIDGTIDLGLRWQPSKNVTADFMAYVGNSTIGAKDTVGFPGYVILNIAF